MILKRKQVWKSNWYGKFTIDKFITLDKTYYLVFFQKNFFQPLSFPLTNTKYIKLEFAINEVKRANKIMAKEIG